VDPLRKRLAGFDPSLPFLDLGCGRGELVGALRAAGIAAEGVEASAGMADLCRKAGVPVRENDLFAELRDLPDASLAGISAIQVVEHLDVEAMLELLALAFDKLVPRGVLLLETIDVRCLYALRWWFSDPTHVLPLTPDTLAFFVRSAGFRDVEKMGREPVPEGIAAPPGESPGVDRLADVVFGTQDFAVLASRPE
jgi:SAM-dependent methyltransferase